MTAHNTLSGAELHDPKGVYPTPAGLPDQSEAWRLEDPSGYGVINVDLVDNDILVGSSDRSINLKVYDSGAGAYVTLGASGGSSIVAPRKFSATAPTGTVQWLLNFEGNLNDSSGNGYTATLGGVAGGTARYPYYVGPGGAVRGFLFDGQTWLTRSLTGAAGLDITGAITVEALIAPMAIQKYNIADMWLDKYGFIVACSNSSSTGTPLQYSRYSLINGAISDTYRKVRWGHEGAGTAYLLDDDDMLPFGALQVLTATRDSAGTALKIYLNGYEVASTTVGAAPSGTAPDQVSVGAVTTATASDQYTFTGLIASLRITNAEFSAAQVLSEAQSAMGW
jgi:hypothetical protein